MYISPIYSERGVAQSWWQRFVCRIEGAWELMTNIATGGVTLPTWFLAVVTAAAIAGSGAGIKMAWVMGDNVAAVTRQANDSAAAIQREDNRIDHLEGVMADVASMKSDLASTKSTAERTDDKVDRLIERQLTRQHP